MSPYPAPLPAPPPPPQAQALRTRRAIVTLFFLAPVVAEMISGSTPPLGFLNPFQLVGNLVLYGPGALIIREVARRRGLGWANILVMGVAYSVLEEGLALQTWFDTTSASPTHSYGAFGIVFGVNWFWVVLMAIYHSIISIATPIMLVEMLFPALAAHSWFRNRGLGGIVALQLGGAGLVALAVSALIGPHYGYYTPIGPYLLTIDLLIGIFALGSSVPLHLPPIHTQRPLPRLWTLRFAMFGAVVGYFAIAIVVAPALRIAALAITVMLVYFAVLLWRVRAWAARPGWGQRQQLAMITGWMAFFIFVFVPFSEFVVGNSGYFGAEIVDLLFLLGLILLARRLQQRATQTSPVAATTAATSMGAEGAAAASASHNKYS